jgi:hypothetical protein
MIPNSTKNRHPEPVKQSGFSSKADAQTAQTKTASTLLNTFSSPPALRCYAYPLCKSQQFDEDGDCLLCPSFRWEETGPSLGVAQKFEAKPDVGIVIGHNQSKVARSSDEWIFNYGCVDLGTIGETDSPRDSESQTPTSGAVDKDGNCWHAIFDDDEELPVVDTPGITVADLCEIAVDRVLHDAPVYLSRVDERLHFSREPNDRGHEGALPEHWLDRFWSRSFGVDTGVTPATIVGASRGTPIPPWPTNSQLNALVRYNPGTARRGRGRGRMRRGGFGSRVIVREPSRPLQRVSAPLANQLTLRPSPARVLNRTDNSFVLRNTETLGALSSGGRFVVGEFPVAPSSFPIMAHHAQAFSRWRLLDFKFTYMGAASADTTGTVAISVAYGGRKKPLTLDGVMAHRNPVMGNVWTQSLSVSVTQSRNIPWFNTIGRNDGFTSEAVVYVGRSAGIAPAPVREIGVLRVDYVVEFSESAALEVIPVENFKDELTPPPDPGVREQPTLAEVLLLINDRLTLE